MEAFGARVTLFPSLKVTAASSTRTPAICAPDPSHHHTTSATESASTLCQRRDSGVNPPLSVYDRRWRK